MHKEKTVTVQILYPYGPEVKLEPGEDLVVEFTKIRKDGSMQQVYYSSLIQIAAGSFLFRITGVK